MSDDDCDLDCSGCCCCFDDDGCDCCCCCDDDCCGDDCCSCDCCGDDCCSCDCFGGGSGSTPSNDDESCFDCFQDCCVDYTEEWFDELGENEYEQDERKKDEKKEGRKLSKKEQRALHRCNNQGKRCSSIFCPRCQNRNSGKTSSGGGGSGGSSGIGNGNRSRVIASVQMESPQSQPQQNQPSTYNNQPGHVVCVDAVPQPHSDGDVDINVSTLPPSTDQQSPQYQPPIPQETQQNTSNHQEDNVFVAGGPNQTQEGINGGSETTNVDDQKASLVEEEVPSSPQKEDLDQQTPQQTSSKDTDVALSQSQPLVQPDDSTQKIQDEDVSAVAESD